MRPRSAVPSVRARGESKDSDAVIVGAGPAGLACAASLKATGLAVTIVDRADSVARLGGTITIACTCCGPAPAPRRPCSSRSTWWRSKAKISGGNRLSFGGPVFAALDQHATPARRRADPAILFSIAFVEDEPEVFARPAHSVAKASCRSGLARSAGRSPA